MKKMFVLAALAALLVTGAAPTANAAGIIYNNGGPNQVYGTQMSEFLVAENFTLGAAASITNIRFWSLQSASTDYTGSMYWGIYGDAAGSPGAAALHSGVAGVAGSATGSSTLFNYAEYLFDIPVSFTLGAGNFWLGLHNGSLATTDPTEMLWETTSIPVGSAGKYLDSFSGWTDSGNEHAFRLDGGDVTNPVPEPSSPLTLLASGLAIALFRRMTTTRAAKA